MLGKLLRAAVRECYRCGSEIPWPQQTEKSDGLASQVFRLMRRSADFNTMENHLHVRSLNKTQRHLADVCPALHHMLRDASNADAHVYNALP